MEKFNIDKFKQKIQLMQRYSVVLFNEVSVFTTPEDGLSTKDKENCCVYTFAKLKNSLSDIEDEMLKVLEFRDSG